MFDSLPLTREERRILAQIAHIREPDAERPVLHAQLTDVSLPTYSPIDEIKIRAIDDQIALARRGALTPSAAREIMDRAAREIEALEAHDKPTSY